MITLPPFPNAFAPITPHAMDRLSWATRRWEKWGAQWVDLPWCAPNYYVQSTRPVDILGEDVTTPYGQLVASGEQSFLWLAEHGMLPEKNWCIGWTPCFRDDALDEMHHYGFIKAELFAWVNGWHPDRDNFTSMLCLNQMREATRRSVELFSELISSHHPGFEGPWPQIVSVPPDRPDDVMSWDVVWDGIELGSYGVRHHPVLKRPYVFGTAIAEPRLNYAMEKLVG